MALSVVEQIVALWAEAYAEEAGEAVPFVYGEQARHAFANGAPPRVLVVHRGGSHTQPRRDVGRPIEVRSANPADALPLSIAVESLSLECWGADTGQADTLWRNVCALLRAQHGDAIDLKEFSWTTEQAARASLITEGAVKSQTVTLRMIVPSALSPLCTVETTAHSGYLRSELSDEGCQCTEPEEPGGP